jgi:hypothetical protein
LRHRFVHCNPSIHFLNFRGLLFHSRSDSLNFVAYPGGPGKLMESLNVLTLGSVKVCMKPKASIIAFAFAASWTPFNLWAQQSDGELLKQARVTKHQAKQIALARVKRGTIKSAELEKENGALIWSFDIAQPGKKNLTEVWVDATTGKINAVNVETPTVEKKEAAEAKVKKFLSRQGKSP